MSSSSESAPCAIAFFSPELMSGGTQRHLLEVLRLIDRERFHPLVISVKSGGPLGEAMRELGVELHELGLGSSMVSRDVVRCVRTSASLLRQHAAQLVQYFEWRSGVVALAAARLAGRPRIVAARRSVRRERGAQGVLAELVVQAADHVVVNAEALRPRGPAARRTDVIPSGVDTDRFRVAEPRAAAKARLGVASERALVGTVGRLESRKGTDVLIEAIAALHARGVRDLTAVIVGDGPRRAELRALAVGRGLADDVRFLGDRSDVRDLLAALDVFVLPSRTEGMSNALLEAMAMERAVVATAVGGNPEVVSDAVSGLLVPGDDPGAMAIAIERLLHDPALGDRLGRAAREAVEARYGSRAMVRRLEAVYATVASHGGAAAGGRRRTGAAPRSFHSLEECL